MSEPFNTRSVRPAERLADELERPALDNRLYRVIRLPNQLEALLIHDPDTDKVSAALDVNTGSFSDADDMPGMAHAVEHLLFMGTEKYPKENAYNEYLTRRSGYSNAYTASTSTNYYFELSAFSTPSNSVASSGSSARTDVSSIKLESPLYGALDRFAQFFVAPLFLEETLDRELKAVDSENKKNLQSDTWRLHQLNKSLSNPKHPFCHFSTGNYQTLHDEPLKRGVKIRDEFIKFYQKNYSANRMKLVVLGRENLDELESWVQELFSEVKNKDLPRNRWDDVAPYTETELAMQVFAKPVLDTRILDMYFPYQDEEELYESQPGRYISHLIGHEGPGSILAYIKGKGWANSLAAGPMPLCPGSSLFSISVRLTEDGLKHYQEVATTVFQYISMLRESAPQEWIFDEIKGMSVVDFKFKQKSPASKTTSGLSSVMQRPLPRQWLLSGSSLIRKFNPEAISSGLSYLRPDNVRLTVVSQDFPGNWDKKERWYGTEYRYEKMSEDFRASLEKAAHSNAQERPSDLHLPEKNEFIPTKLEVEKKEVTTPAKTPKLIRNDENTRTWYKKDDRFWVPKANVHVTLRTPLANLTPETAMITHLYKNLVNDALTEYSYAAEISGLEYNLSSHALGLDVSVSGYNDKMSVLLEKVLISLRDLKVNEDRFQIIKDRLLRGLRNWDLQQPYHQVGTYSRVLRHDKGWTNDQFLAVLPSITAEDVKSFFPQLLRQMHIEVLAHGNLYKEDALKMTDLVESILRPRKLPPSQWPIRRALVSPEGSNYVYKRTLKDPANVNHCIEYMLAVGDNHDRPLRAKLLLTAQMTDEPAFDTLRTKEQLGYVVFSGAQVYNTLNGYRVLIQSEKSPEYLETRIDSFLAGFGKILEAMTDEEFEAHKTSLINKRLERLKNLTQETNRFNTHILSEHYDFEQVDHDVAHIEPLAKADLVAFYNHYIHPSSPARAKLSVHMLAQSSPSDIAAKITPEEQSSKIQTLVTQLLNSQGIATDAEKLTARLKDVKVSDVDAVVKAITAHLVEDQKIEHAKAAEIVKQGQSVITIVLPSVGIEAVPQTDGASSDSSNNTGSKEVDGNGTEPVEITDVHAFKASLSVSAGARPVRDLSEFEDLESKL
ncbi:metalloprotease [Coniosporium tulheliwenetii]|uniref:Metalloprotease n=1 Tax=Coniosporium tulheliwenetii TaxID=3383036 RepID=A0ACC2YXF2_9PEZI|nr:metalloprotease [Cladosporium sp. JES 115]